MMILHARPFGLPVPVTARADKGVAVRRPPCIGLCSQAHERKHVGFLASFALVGPEPLWFAS